MNGKRVMKWSLVCLIVIALGISIGAMSYIAVSVKRFDQIYASNVSIEGISVGGLTREEARAKIESKAEEYLETKTVTLARGDLKVALNLKDLPVKYESESALDAAYAIGHDRKFFDRYALATNRHILAPIDIQMDYTFNEDQVTGWVTDVAPQFEKKAVDATIERTNRKFIVTPEKDGEAMDIPKTSEKVTHVLKTGKLNEVVEVVTTPLKPHYTAEALEQVQTPIASFQTNYNNADPLRNQNLKVASQKINTVLEPGEIFSLGKQIEPITYEEGYRSSKVIVNGQLEDGIGGGVCQIASTLYNAVLLSNLDITMRQNHSLSVAYVPLGRDATYSTDIIDFRFKNTSEYPVFIESYCEGNQVVVNIFSHKSLKPAYDEVKFYSETIEVIPAPPTQYQDDPTLELGKKVQKVSALEGKKVKLYKMCYNKGELVHKELVNQSYYRERAAIVSVGTKAPDQPKVNATESFMEMEPELSVDQEKILGND